MHENNILNKINDNYKGIKEEIDSFYKNTYLPFKENVSKLVFDKKHMNDFKIFTNLINDYCEKLRKFSKDKKIDARSKFESTFLEEINCHLFKDLPKIKTETYQIFNKCIFAGLKINPDDTIEIISKDVDFCIGRKTTIKIGTQAEKELTIPLIAVEVKTYLDATMFGEIKSSSRDIKNANPMAKTYVLMGYKNIKNDHIIAAKNDSTITEMFVLRKKSTSKIDEQAVIDYWETISEDLRSSEKKEKITTPGKLFNRR